MVCHTVFDVFYFVHGLLEFFSHCFFDWIVFGMFFLTPCAKFCLFYFNVLLLLLLLLLPPSSLPPLPP